MSKAMRPLKAWREKGWTSPHGYALQGNWQIVP
jgi:hypothetical protein